LFQTNSNEISETELERISQLKTPHQVLAVVKQFEVTQPDVSGFVLYLDTVQDPGNFGTIIRIADWFGVKHIVCSAGCADHYNPKVVQSTMASIARVNVFYDETNDWLQQQNTTIYAASLHGKPLSQFSKTEKGILIIGNESKGIREDFLKLANEPVTIPRRGEAESLNAAVATGILLSHLIALTKMNGFDGLNLSNK
jgi:TrmH family RNA methyltransferase